MWTTYGCVTTTCSDATTIRLPGQAIPRIPHRLGVSGFLGSRALTCGQNARTSPIGHNASVKKTSAALMAVPLAASLLLAACGGDAKPGASSSSTSTSSPTTTAPPTVSPTTDPNIPVAARAHTPAGAEAFTKYFFAQLNRSWSTADPSLLPPLSESGCKTCSAFTASAASYQTKKQHYKGELFTVSSIAALGKGLKGEEVLVAGKQQAGAIVDQAGKVIETSVAQAGKFVISLRWAGSGWKAVELQVER